MWSTSYGDRTLNKAEAAVYLEAVAYTRDMLCVSVDINESHHVGVASFDRLQPTQQLAALHAVTMALVNPDVPPPPLCATLEGTIYAVYKNLYSLVEVEIDHSRDGHGAFGLRKAILGARRSDVVSENDWHNCEGADGVELTSYSSEDMDAWESEIEELVNQILWDRDFELEDLIADQDPNQVTAVKDYLGISRDYFSIPAPDANSEEYLRLDRELVELRKLTPTLFK
jgi:hypothetical protein